MALSTTLKTSGANRINSANAWSTASFTPSNNSLLVVLLGVVDDNAGDVGEALTVTDNLGSHLTYTPRVTQGRSGGYKAQARAWTAPVTTGAAMTISFDCGANSIYSSGWAVYEVTGHNATTPTGGKASSASDTNDGAISITLDAAPASGDYTLALVWLDGDSSGTVAVTPGADFGEVAEFGDTTVTAYGQTQSRTGSTSTTVAWQDIRAGTMSTYSHASVALVIKADSGGTVNASVSAVAATASAASIAPHVSSGVSVAGVAATATAQAYAPSVGIAVQVVGVAATATAAGIAPAVSAGANISAVTAQATAAGIAPAISGSAGVAGVAGTASAAGIAPTVSGGAGVLAVAAEASAAGIAPAISAGATIGATTAGATAEMPAPVVDVSGSVTVSAVAATATAEAIGPAVSADASIGAVTATATAEAYPPVVDTSGAATVYAVTATASAAFSTPTISADANIRAETASATAQAYAPGVGVNGDVYAVCAEASALFSAPVLVADSSISATTASASATLWPPRVTVVAAGAASVPPERLYRIPAETRCAEVGPELRVWRVSREERREG